MAHLKYGTGKQRPCAYFTRPNVEYIIARIQSFREMPKLQCFIVNEVCLRDVNIILESILLMIDKNHWTESKQVLNSMSLLCSLSHPKQDKPLKG